MEIPFNSEFMINVAKAENSKNVLKNNPKSSHALQKAAQDFEAVLLNMVLKAMWKLRKTALPKYMNDLCTHHSQRKWPVMVVWVLQKYLLNNLVESRKTRNLIKWNKISWKIFYKIFLKH